MFSFAIATSFKFQPNTSGTDNILKRPRRKGLRRSGSHSEFNKYALPVRNSHIAQMATTTEAQIPPKPMETLQGHKTEVHKPEATNLLRSHLTCE